MSLIDDMVEISKNIILNSDMSKEDKEYCFNTLTECIIEINKLDTNLFLLENGGL